MLVKLKALIINIENLSTHDISELWINSRKYLLVFGIAILGFKFRNILMNWSIRAAERIYNRAQEKNNALSVSEEKAEKQANTLINDAKNLPNTEENPVTDDWYKKKD